MPDTITRDVPCNGCTLCCQSMDVWITDDDDAGQYETVVDKDSEDGELKLAEQRNGDCIYLDRKTGCTIHDRRPTLCREFDCRAELISLQPKEIIDNLGDEIVQRALTLLHELEGDELRKIRESPTGVDAPHKITEERESGA